MPDDPKQDPSPALSGENSGKNSLTYLRPVCAFHYVAYPAGKCPVCVEIEDCDRSLAIAQEKIEMLEARIEDYQRELGII